jgi:hypothetical protein
MDSEGGGARLLPGGSIRLFPAIAAVCYLSSALDSVSISGDTFSHCMEISVSASAIMTLVTWHTSIRENVPTGSGAGQPRVKTISAYMAAPRDGAFAFVCTSKLRAARPDTPVDGPLAWLAPPVAAAGVKFLDRIAPTIRTRITKRSGIYHESSSNQCVKKNCQA